MTSGSSVVNPNTSAPSDSMNPLQESDIKLIVTKASSQEDGDGSWFIASKSEDEELRLKALDVYAADIAQAYRDVSDDLNLDRYTSLAAALCDTPISFINIIARDTHWIGSEYGFSEWRNRVGPRDGSLCAHTILRKSRDVHMITNAQQDLKYLNMPMVRGPPYTDFYLGVPITTPQGHNIGALCVLDTTSKRAMPTERQKKGLSDLAGTIMKELDLRADRLIAKRAKKVFLSSISHELRSPLHGLLASAELMAEDGNLTPFQDVCTKTISNCGKTLCDVIDHVLSFADSETKIKKLEEVDLPSFVEEILDSTWAGKAGLKERGVQLEVLVEVNLTHLRHPFRINRGEIGRIVMNLFGNSIKYTSHGSLSVKIDAQDPPFHRADRRLQLVTMIFRDTGKGINADFMPKLFEPFVQEDQKCDGFGLGLSLVKQLVEKNEGSIEVESVCGKGTTITVKLLLDAVKAESQIESEKLKDEFSSLENVHFTLYQGNSPVSDALRESLISTCQDNFAMVHAPLHNSEIVLLIDEADLEQVRKHRLTIPIVVFAPESKDPRISRTMYLQIPIGPYKLGRAIKTAIAHHEQSMYQVRRSSIVHLDPVSPPTSAPYRDQDPMSLIDSNLTSAGPRTPKSQLSSHTNYFQAPSYQSTKVQPSDDTSRVAEMQQNFSFGRPKLERPKLEECDLHAVDDDAAIQSTNHTTFRALHCLCVDDNPINLQILATLLKKNGLTYENATDGQAALELYHARQKDNKFDVIFMDIHLPKLSGSEATKAIRSHEASNKLEPCVIAALTGESIEDVQEDAEMHGFDRIFTKPVSMRTLSEFVQQHRRA